MKFKPITSNGSVWGYAWRCPGCQTEHHVPTTGPNAWGFNGSVESPTLSPSVLVYSHPTLDDHGQKINTPRCHSFVQEGRIIYCSDSEHDLAGKTIEMVEL